MSKSTQVISASGYRRLPQVLIDVPVGATTLWRWCRQGLFPKPVKLGARVTAWREEDVQAWLKKAGEARQ